MLAMKLVPVQPVVWSSFLLLWASQCRTEDSSDICQNVHTEEVKVQGSSGEENFLLKNEVNETFFCYLYPTNELNCSWSFQTLQKDTQLSVYISICSEDTVTQSWNNSNEERVGSHLWTLNEPMDLHFVLQFNMSLHNNWTSYTYVCEQDMIEVLSPPSNISVSVKDEVLQVTWGLPGNRLKWTEQCFEYELDLGDQERNKSLTNRLSYEEPYDCTRTYRVRIRARTVKNCNGSPQWSDWSDTITVEQQPYKLNMLVIISISLGIPMILLAVLLLVRYQRVSKILFPPIPRPPLKYIYFLEKNDTPSSFYPAQAAKTEEEITEVEDTEENSGTTL
ncbi:granulocyte-macrophage colony-stimulating factor receptor subunit alpha-like isoform X2 [Anabas testudineus]|uniref:granulocyte-macrophage colony-stimulating factor receptor subunit alpha-like isoform X2 n=1 Tax=Anabas testudineus TaxID=64144 RepID=UPI000E457981|nr:granulocyte-macrophage colony-stimulating factor receptor subunit alpha-like isoform X2 [Anabas testudineus]